MATWQECREYGLIKIEQGGRHIKLFSDMNQYGSISPRTYIGLATDAYWSGSGVIVELSNGSKLRYSDFMNYVTI